MRTVAVVGASLAGLSAARALREQSYAGRIVVIGAESHRPYDRPPLSKGFLTGTCTEAELALTTADDDALDLDWRLGSPAVALDRRTRTLLLAGGDEVRADGVVIATGARARLLPGMTGADAASVPTGTRPMTGVHVLRTLDNALALRAALTGAQRLVVIGAGFIGAEVAASAQSLGLDVTVVEALPTPLAGPLGAEMGAVCAGLHADHGVRLLTGVGVAGLIGSGQVESVELADGTRLPADVVVVGVGAQPNVEWLSGSGVEVLGGVVTDATYATNVPGIVAVGDCAAAYNVYADGVLRIEHWTCALEQPAVAVATLLGGDNDAVPRLAAVPRLNVPYFWSDQYGTRLQFAGHRREGDAVRVVEGDPDDRSFLAVYERAGRPVAVLGMNQPKQFTRWRRQLGAPRAAATLA